MGIQYMQSGFEGDSIIMYYMYDGDISMLACPMSHQFVGGCDM